MSETMEDLCHDNLETKSAVYVSRIRQGDVALVSVVEELGPLLTDKVVARRKLGLQCLTKMLATLGEDFLNQDECKFLAKFYQDRMRDHHDLIPVVIEGMDSLVRMTNLSQNDLQTLLRSSFEEIHVQSQMLIERSRVFGFHNFLLNQKLTQLTSMKLDYLLGFIQAVDEEKDPTNLLVIFSTWPLILANFDLEPMTEDAFESLSCYFPIDFTPPSGAYPGITKEKLVLSLRRCLAETPGFASLAIPLFLEKLDSDIVDAKIDAADSLTVCLNNCPPEAVATSLEAMWKSLEREILGIRLQKDDRVVKSCLSVITALTKCLAYAVQTPENRALLTKWLATVWTHCGNHLKEIELKFMASSVNIFAAIVASRADYPSIFVLDRAMPILLSLHKPNVFSKDQSDLYDYIALLLKDAPEPVLPKDWCDHFIFICNVNLTTTDHFVSTKASIFRALTHGSQFLKADHAEQIFVTQLENVLSGNIPTFEMVQLFGALSTRCPRPSDDDFKRLFGVTKTHPLAVLPVIKVICKQERYLDHIFPQLIALMGSNSGDAFSSAVEIGKEIWMTHKNLTHFFNCSGKDANENFVDTFMRQALMLKHYPLDDHSPLRLWFSDMMHCLTPEDHLGWLQSWIRALINENSVRHFVLLEIIMSPLRPEIVSRLESDLVMSCFASINNSASSESFVSSSKLRASLVNKLPNSDSYVKQWLQMIDDSNLSEYACIQLSWAIRALLLRNHPQLTRVSNLFLKLLTSSDSAFAKSSAMLFSDAVAGENCDFMSYNQTLASLARQKLFTITKPRLIEAFRNEQNASSCLKSILCQLDHLPKSVIAAEITELVPVLVKGLSVQETDVLFETLTALRQLLQQHGKTFGSHLATFMPLWIKLAIDRGHSTIPIRMEALKCIRVASRCDEAEVLKLKPSVLRQLVPALNDHKRIVRTEAYSARNAWSLAPNA